MPTRSQSRPKTVPATGMAAKIQDFDQRIEAAAKKHDCVALVRLMDEIKVAADKVGTVKAQLEGLYGRIRFSKLPDAMEEAELENFRVEGIGNCYLQDDIALQEVNKDKLQTWFIEHELEDMVTETINHSTLAAYVRRLMKSGSKEDAATLKQLKTMMKIKPVVRAVITK